MNLPREGEYIAIQSYKHDGSFHRTWLETMVLKSSDDEIIGCNDHTLVIEGDGRRWVTREPAIIFFHRKFWFNVVAMIKETGITYYCNLASPYTLDKEALKYIDYDLDIKVFPDGEKRLIDIDEYAAHQKLWQYPETTDEILHQSVLELLTWIDEKKGPFSQEFVDFWYSRYLELVPKNSHSKK